MKELIDNLRALRASITDVIEFIEDYDDFGQRGIILSTLDNAYNDIGDLIREVQSAHEQ